MAVVEFACAIFRKVREAGIDEQEAAELIRDFFGDIEHTLVVPLGAPEGDIISEAIRLCQEERLRAADSIHLATALMLSRQSGLTPLRFLSADIRLLQVASRWGLFVQEAI